MNAFYFDVLQSYTICLWQPNTFSHLHTLILHVLKILVFNRTDWSVILRDGEKFRHEMDFNSVPLSKSLIPSQFSCNDNVIQTINYTTLINFEALKKFSSLVSVSQAKRANIFWWAIFSLKVKLSFKKSIRDSSK